MPAILAANRPPLSSDGYDAAVAPPKPPTDPGMPMLTGNKEADDDILAFQRAREELYELQRRQLLQQQGGGGGGGGGGPSMDAQAKR